MPDIESLVEQRRQEAINASAEVGVTDVRFLGYDDVLDLPDRALAADIADVIGDVRPDIVITHWPYDTVPAHANATQLTLLAFRPLRGFATRTTRHTRSSRSSTTLSRATPTPWRTCAPTSRPR